MTAEYDENDSNLDAARSNDQLKALYVLRDSLAQAMDVCKPEMLPQIAGQYRATLTEIVALQPPKVKPKTKTKLDEVTAKRMERQRQRKTA